MITPKPLLSENVKDFMDYALDVIKSMDGAPEHSIEDQSIVNEKLAKLKEYLELVSISYHETVPKINAANELTDNFSGTGHS
ncbi:hypothetical protein EZ449_02635 [Pedobacter frigidisoli]|uniref:Uncharacterized protein n=1 Tax=Pedobacter frigidisoli TaxID=2530455 RepID=A0A4R0P7G2_9SPHI|nr:hypothetical protein [Pedobacter frigidisoli]TCD12961.1 hypothetical protein EZ449_02635 [Pedobacter frigidisoli]